MREVGNNTTEVFEGLFEQLASLSQGQIGESEFEVRQADTALTRQRRKEGAAHEYGNSRGERKRQQRELRQKGANGDVFEHVTREFHRARLLCDTAKS